MGIRARKPLNHEVPAGAGALSMENDVDGAGEPKCSASSSATVESCFGQDADRVGLPGVVEDEEADWLLKRLLQKRGVRLDRTVVGRINVKGGNLPTSRATAKGCLPRNDESCTA